MNKLYHCNATCNGYTLVSYNTTIFYTDAKDNLIANIVPTTTTLMHIRKYVRWCKENGHKRQSERVQHLYNIWRATHKTQLCLCTDGNVIDNYTGEVLDRVA